MIEYPGDVFDWGYCQIPVDAYGFEIPLLDLSCEVDPTATGRLVSVDYFGRLSAGRTKETNLRMHFDEVISNIKLATIIDVDASGRVVLGSDCTGETCTKWKTIDSPLENMGLYHRLMKYGHFQTDPLEEDTSAHGDPAAGPVYHPALEAADFAKFRVRAQTLLSSTTPTDCYAGTTFIAACAAQQGLTAADFNMAASFLGAASDKHGKTTMDLVHYMNRILRIPVATTETPAALNTVPALVRDENGVIAPAPAGLPAPGNERFVDYSAVSYLRADRYTGTFPAVVANGDGTWQEASAVSVIPFLRFINGAMDAAVTDGSGFVRAVSDGQRTIEFVHEYAIPEDIKLVGAATTTTVPPHTATFSAGDQTVVLTAQVTDSEVVNVGTVIFTVVTPNGVALGIPATSDIVTNGVARGNYVLPANTPAQTLVIVASYGGGVGFAASYGRGSLELTGATTTTTTIAPASAPSSATAQTVPLRGVVTALNASPIDVGTVTFTVRDGDGTTIGAPLTAAVASNVANAAYVLPGGVADQTLTITGVFSGSTNFFTSTGTGTLIVGCPAVVILPATLPQATLNAVYNAVLTFSGTAPATASLTGTLPPGLTMTSAGVISGIPTQTGAFPITVNAVDAGSCTGSQSYVMTVGAALTFLTGLGAGEAPTVKPFSMTGAPGTEFLGINDPTFLGGVRVATGDVNQDGVADTISGAGVNGGARVTVKDGATGAVLHDFPAFAEYLPDGVYVASGDVNNDGFSDIVVGAGSGVARIRVFNGLTGTLLKEFTAFAGQLATGVRVGAADVNADGVADIIAGAGPGGTPTVQVLDGADGTVVTTFHAYAELFGGGVFVAGADVSGDGFGDIITGAGEGGGPHVRVWNGRTFTEIMSFFAFEATSAGGVRVAGSDLNRDGKAEIIAGRGPLGLMTVNVFDGATGTQVSSFLAKDTDRTSGLYVAGAGSLARMSVDVPINNATVPASFAVGGWAFDSASVSGVGVDAVHVWAYPTNGSVPVLVGVATLGGDRPDVAAAFGDPWRYSGFNVDGTLAPGVYDLVVYVHSSVSETFNNRRVVRITVQ